MKKSLRRSKAKFVKKNNLLTLVIFFHLWIFAQQNPITLFNQAVEIHKQDPTRALNLLEQVLQLDPLFIDAHYNCAYIYKQLGNMQAALPHYEYVLAQQPQNSSAHIGIAQAYLALGNYEKGWQELEW